MRTATVALGITLLSIVGCSGDDPPAPSGPAGSSPSSSSPGAPGTSEPPGPPGSFAPGARSGANPPTITGFTVPTGVPCEPGQTATIPVSYQTTGAITVTFTVGTEQVKGYPPLSGTFDVPIPCDGNAHTIVLFAVAGDMSTNTESKAVIAG